MIDKETLREALRDHTSNDLPGHVWTGGCHEVCAEDLSERYNALVGTICAEPTNDELEQAA